MYIKYFLEYMTATSCWANVLLSTKKARIKITLWAIDQQVSHESKIWRIQKITLFAPLSSCHFPSNFLCVLSARSATDGPPRNFFAVGKTGPGPTWRRVRVRNWPPRSLWCCLRGDVGLPGTVRGHFKERDLTGFPAHFLGRKLAFSQPRLSHWG